MHCDQSVSVRLKRQITHRIADHSQVSYCRDIHDETTVKQWYQDDSFRSAHKRLCAQSITDKKSANSSTKLLSETLRSVTLHINWQWKEHKQHSSNAENVQCIQNHHTHT